MRLPEGDLLRSRVVADPAEALAAALERRLTGYAVLEPQETLLLEGDARGAVVFEEGVPILAYHAGTDGAGPQALADLAVPGPYGVELVAAEGVTDLRAPDREVPPGMPAERLAGDPDLAARTRERAPENQEVGDGDRSAVEAFLEDAEKIDAIREQAREEARRRACEWDLADLQDA